jgi:tetratricopeptide (TPR) repeat protein
MRRIKSLLAVTGVLLALGAVPVFAMGGASPAPSMKSNRDYLDGERAIKAKDYAKAIPSLERAWNNDKGDPDVNNLLGYAHRKMGNTQVALNYYTRALQADANHKGANEYLGELYVELNDLPKAKERLAKLTQVCGGTSCEEYRDLKAAIDKAEASPSTGPRTGS